MSVFCRPSLLDSEAITVVTTSTTEATQETPTPIPLYDPINVKLPLLLLLEAGLSDFDIDWTSVTIKMRRLGYDVDPETVNQLGGLRLEFLQILFVPFFYKCQQIDEFLPKPILVEYALRRTYSEGSRNQKPRWRRRR